MPVIFENLHSKSSKTNSTQPLKKFDKFLNIIALTLVRSYQIVLSPILGGACRFHPTCSAYATQAFNQYNFKTAFILTTKRLLKCRPFGAKGFDPVPECKNTN